MQKKLLAVAVAGALGAPALAVAQSSTVQVFGTMYIEYGLIDQPNAAASAATQATSIGGKHNVDLLQTPGSEIGFKGEEKLGGGLSAWFQCASTADPRGTGSVWCARNSALGMKGGFGNFFVGNWNSPFSRTMSPNQVGSNDTGLFGSASLLTSDSTTDAVGANRANFKKRQNRSFNYDSPNFGGFQVMGMWSDSGPSTLATSGATNSKPRIMSFGAQYSAGPLFVGAGYEKHKEYAGAAGQINSSDSGWHIGAAYTWGPVRVGGLYTRQEFDAPPVAPFAGSEIKARAWHVGVDWRIVGPHGLRAAYTKAQDMKGPAGSGLIGTAGGTGYRPAIPVATISNDTGADLWQIRYVYTFSKRTEFNFGYVKLDNDAQAAYRLNGLGTAASLTQLGQSEDAFAMSVRHTF